MANIKKKTKKDKEYVSFYELAGEEEEYTPQIDLIGKKGLYIGYTGRIVSYAILSIISFIAAFFAFSNGISYKNIQSYKYNEDGKLNYQVFLNENNYYEQQSLESGMNYLTSLIDYIDLGINYTYVGSKNTDIKYMYGVTAELKVYDTKNGNKVLFEKKYTILPEKLATMTNRQLLEIKENIKIDYDYYNVIAKNFKRDFNLAATSDLKLLFHVKTELPKYDSEYTEHEMDMTIPLTEQTINIAMKNNSIANSKNIIHQDNTTITNMYLTILACIAVIIGVILLSRAMHIILLTKSKKTPYSKKLNQILREYDRAITITKTMIKISPEDNVIDIASFEELLDIRDTLNVPILFNEIHKGQKSWFIIRKGMDVYKYVLKASELEKPPVKE